MRKLSPRIEVKMAVHKEDKTVAEMATEMADIYMDNINEAQLLDPVGLQLILRYMMGVHILKRAGVFMCLQEELVERGIKYAS